MPWCHLQNLMVVVKVAVGSMISTSGSIALYKRVRSDETFLGDSVVLWITQILCPILSVPSEEGNFSYPRGRAVMVAWIRFGFITQSHRFPKAELCLGKEMCDMLTGVTQCSETGQEHRTDAGEQWKQQIRAVGWHHLQRTWWFLRRTSLQLLSKVSTLKPSADVFVLNLLRMLLERGSGARWLILLLTTANLSKFSSFPRYSPFVWWFSIMVSPL